MKSEFGTFKDFEAEYESFDVPALLAEAATAPGVMKLNQALAMFVRLANLIGETEMPFDDRIKGATLALTLQKITGTHGDDPLATHCRLSPLRFQ